MPLVDAPRLSTFSPTGLAVLVMSVEEIQTRIDISFPPIFILVLSSATFRRIQDLYSILAQGVQILIHSPGLRSHGVALVPTIYLTDSIANAPRYAGNPNPGVSTCTRDKLFYRCKVLLSVELGTAESAEANWSNGNVYVIQDEQLCSWTTR